MEDNIQHNIKIENIVESENNLLTHSGVKVESGDQSKMVFGRAVGGINLYDEDRQCIRPFACLLHVIGPKGRVFLCACLFFAIIIFSIHIKTFTQLIFICGIIVFIVYNAEILRGKYKSINLICVLLVVGIISISAYTFEKYETISTVPAFVAYYRLDTRNERIVPYGRYKNKNQFLIKKDVSDEEFMAYIQRLKKLNLEYKISSYDGRRMLYSNGRIFATYYRKEKEKFSIIFVS